MVKIINILYLFQIFVIILTPKIICMNKSELIDAIAAETSLTKVDSRKAIEALIKALTASLKDGGTVVLTGFGSFNVAKRSARTGRNPHTGKPLDIKAKNVIRFKAGAGLLGSVQ
jgi:DNA-binding protein HU-beta